MPDKSYDYTAALGCSSVSVANGVKIHDCVAREATNDLLSDSTDSAPLHRFTFCPKGDNEYVTGISVELVASSMRDAIAEKQRDKILTGEVCGGKDMPS